MSAVVPKRKWECNSILHSADRTRATHNDLVGHAGYGILAIIYVEDRSLSLKDATMLAMVGGWCIDERLQATALARPPSS